MQIHAIQWVTIIISLLLHGMVLYTVERLERIGCQCALDWRRNYIEVFMKLAIGWIVLTAALAALHPSTLAHPVYQGAMVVMYGLNIVYIVLALQYLSRIRREDCACSESLLREVWQVLVWVQTAALVLLVVLSILSLLLGLYMAMGAVRPKVGRAAASVVARRGGRA